MSSYTQKVTCRKCGGDDRNLTEIRELVAGYHFLIFQEFCNSCGEFISKIYVNGFEVPVLLENATRKGG